MSEIKLYSPIPNTSLKSKLDSYHQKSPSKGLPPEECFRQDASVQNQVFKEIYQDYCLGDFVSQGLATEDELKEIHKENPTCIEALKEIQVAAALGIGNCDPEKKPRISIKDLRGLDSTKLNKIIYRCLDSEAVIEEVQSAAKLVPNTMLTQARRA